MATRDEVLHVPRRRTLTLVWVSVVAIALSTGALVMQFAEPDRPHAPEQTIDLTVHSTLASTPLKLTVAYAPIIWLGDETAFAFNTRIATTADEEDRYRPVEWTIRIDAPGVITAPQTPF